MKNDSNLLDEPTLWTELMWLRSPFDCFFYFFYILEVWKMQLFDSIFQNAKCCRSDEKVYFGINFTFLGILQEGADPIAVVFFIDFSNKKNTFL